MLNFLKPTRFKLIATAVFLVVIWFVPTVNNWFLLNVIFNMYPTLVDSMRQIFSRGWNKRMARDFHNIQRFEDFHFGDYGIRCSVYYC
jgi:hypothetical protein